MKSVGNMIEIYDKNACNTKKTSAFLRRKG